jgi:uncharacterized DUF497 family protein
VPHPSDAEWVEIDDQNEGHLARHSVSAAEIVQVFSGDPKWARNKKGMAGIWLMVGRTWGGRPIVAVVVYDETRQCVRPITARACGRHEVTRWKV